MCFSADIVLFQLNSKNSDQFNSKNKNGTEYWNSANISVIDSLFELNQTKSS